MPSKNGERLRRLGAIAAVFIICAAPLSCNTDELLDVTDPDIINPTDVNSAAAAEALRAGALLRLSSMTSGGEGVFHYPGLLTDEWRSGDTFAQRDETDKRSIQASNANLNGLWFAIHRTRAASEHARDAIREFSPLLVSDVAQMYWIRGFAETAIAENYCNATPISKFSTSDLVLEFGEPETNAQVYARAKASFDTATSTAGTNARGDTVRLLARIGRARVAINQGQWAAALTEVTGTPAISDVFRYRMFHQDGVNATNQIWALNNSGRRYVIGNRDGGVGLDFATANDPRLPWCLGNDAVCRASGVTNSTSFDNNFGTGTTRIGGPFYVQQIWPSRDNEVTIVSGLEAKLIEAEARLNTGDPVGWLTTLNALRARFQALKEPSDTNTTRTLALLVDPITPAARVDLMMRERAFWLFARGHRLADLRRMARPTAQGGYGRAINTLFPNGTFFKGGTFGTDVNLIVPQSEENNPKYNPSACNTTVP
jgi:SusD/RagB-like outer membrane lipoprotein